MTGPIAAGFAAQRPHSICRVPSAPRDAASHCYAARRILAGRGPGWLRCRSVVATQATWSQPVADAVFSNDLASLRLRPRRPWATLTRQACRMGRKTGCLLVPPDPANLHAMRTAQLVRRLCRHAAVDEHQLLRPPLNLTGGGMQHRERAGPGAVA